MIKVSIIVPVYNVEGYLRKCLNSLVNQTLKEIEIIIVNDGSKDHSERIIQEYARKYSNIRAVAKENGGLSSARNTGMELAEGEYLAFVDSDDWVDTSIYEKMYLKAKENDFDLVMCDFNEIHGETVKTCSCHLKHDLFTKDEILRHMVDYYPSAWNKLYKRELFHHLRFKKGVWFEDVELGYRLLPQLTSIGVVNEPLYYYLIREGSITSTADPRIYHYIDNWNGILEYYHKNGIYHEYKDELEYCYVRYLLATFIKSAAKFNKAEYLCAVDAAMSEVAKHFPDYKKNQYINVKKPKNLYLKHFNRFMAKLFFVIAK